MMHPNLRAAFRVKAFLPLLLMISFRSVAFGQGCPCSAIKLGVDTTKGMKFDTVAYRSSGDSQTLLYDYAAAKSALLGLYGLLYDSTVLDANDLQEFTVKQYGTRTPLPYDYISYVTLSRKGSSLSDFKYKLTLVIKDSAWAGDTILLDTVSTRSLSNIPKDLDSLTATLAPTLKWLAKFGQTIGVDTLRGITFDQEAYKDSASLLAAYVHAKGINDTLLAFYTNQENHRGVVALPFGFVEGDIDLGNDISGNGTSTFAIVKIKNNYWVLDTLTMFNTTSDTLTVRKVDLFQSQFFTLDTIQTQMPLPASLPPGGLLQVVVYICHSSDTSALTPEPVITDPITIIMANHNPQMYTLQAQPVHSSYDYVASATLDRKGKTLSTFYYKLTVLIKETSTGDTVKYDTLDDPSLANIPQDLTTMVLGFSPTYRMLRAHQDSIRTDSADHYIGLKYTIVGAPATIKSNEKSTLLIKVFDCDGKPTAGKHFNIKLDDASQSTLSTTSITTDNNGSATATLTGGPNAEVAKVSIAYTYMTVTHHSAAISDCNSKSVTVGAPYTLTVDATLHVQGKGAGSSNTGDFTITGTAPMELQVTKDDTCGKWVFLDDVTFNMTGKWAGKDGSCTYNGGSYTSPATFVVDSGCQNGAQGTLHIDHIGPSQEAYECEPPGISTGPADGSGQGLGAVDAILLACFNATKMQKGNAEAEGQDKIAQLKALAAKVQADQASGHRNLADYQALMSAVKGGPMGGGLTSFSGLSFNFKDAVNKDSSPAFDYSPPNDAVDSPDAEKSATIHVKIEKSSN